jgi:hypothetical protein
MKFFIYILLTTFFTIELLAQTNRNYTEAEQATKEFKESKFLQIDSLDLPIELKKIEDDVKQNLVDVIIHSRTHTPVFSQKRESGYTDSYKKFHGLKVEISPYKDIIDFYYLKLFYYNWTTNKFDKTLTRKISKYNVLNEVRFALYELLLGKEFVNEHKDEIEKQNFDRIQDVREAINIQKKSEKKEKLQKRLDEEKLQELDEIKKKKSY